MVPLAWKSLEIEARLNSGASAVRPPTSRWARTYGPLSVTDFVKRSSVGYVTSAAYPELALHARRLARYEGFSSHENAVSEIRDHYLAS